MSGPYSPPAPHGRDLRMTFEIHAQADGDQVLSTLIEQAVMANSEGRMYPGKRTTVYGETGAWVELTMTGYRQTWDGDEKPE